MAEALSEKKYAAFHSACSGYDITETKMKYEFDFNLSNPFYGKKM